MLQSDLRPASLQQEKKSPVSGLLQSTPWKEPPDSPQQCFVVSLWLSPLSKRHWQASMLTARPIRERNSLAKCMVVKAEYKCTDGLVTICICKAQSLNEVLITSEFSSKVKRGGTERGKQFVLKDKRLSRFIAMQSTFYTWRSVYYVAALKLIVAVFRIEFCSGIPRTADLCHFSWTPMWIELHRWRSFTTRNPLAACATSKSTWIK